MFTNLRKNNTGFARPRQVKPGWFSIKFSEEYYNLVPAQETKASQLKRNALKGTWNLMILF